MPPTLPLPGGGASSSCFLLWPRPPPWTPTRQVQGPGHCASQPPRDSHSHTTGRRFGGQLTAPWKTRVRMAEAQMRSDGRQENDVEALGRDFSSCFCGKNREVQVCCRAQMVWCSWELGGRRRSHAERTVVGLGKGNRGRDL